MASIELKEQRELCEKRERELDVAQRSLLDHRIPAEELNRELAAYLGHGDLTLQPHEDGYRLLRSGQVAQRLSEGERTAISFLYFLKTLRDGAVDLSETVVVVDDPVSSLDANALFSSFSYMKERTKAAGQLVILTHNLSFLKQVKNWFYNVPNRDVGYYFLATRTTENGRTAGLEIMDDLLRKYESEYHFLFKKVYEAAQGEAGGMAENYHMPNIARRLLEAFLAYRFPDVPGGLFSRLEQANYDEAAKTELRRFLDAYSHGDGIGSLEHNPTILGRTPNVMGVLLEFMRTLDEEHCRRLETLVAEEAPRG